LTSLIPLLIALLNLAFPDDLFVAASEVLQIESDKHKVINARGKLYIRGNYLSEDKDFVCRPSFIDPSYTNFYL
jgi:hypothetical protein